VLEQYIPTVVQFVLEVAGSSQVQFSIRRRSLDFIEWITQ